MDLDPKPDATLVLMEEVCSHFPTINIIALADNADTNLVLAAMRAGCRQFIPKPIDQQDLSKALKLLTRSAGGKTKSDRVICVIGSSGGCGVTTVAANLAVELASLAAEPCALVDLQLEFGSLATYFDTRPAHTIADLTNPGCEIDLKIAEQVMTELPSNVALLARPEHVEQVKHIDPERIAHILKILADKYDSVVVDTPCRFDDISVTALEMATIVLVVLQLSVPSIRNASRLCKTLIKYGMPAEKILPITNRYVRKSPISPEDVTKHLNSGIYAVIPNDYQTVQAALDFGRPLVSDSPDAPVRKAIAEMAKRIYRGQLSTGSADSKHKEGVFSRWFGS